MKKSLEWCGRGVDLVLVGVLDLRLRVGKDFLCEGGLGGEGRKRGGEEEGRGGGYSRILS